MYTFSGTNDLRELAIFYQKNGHYPYYDEYLELYEELNRDRKRGQPELFPMIEDMSYGAQQFEAFWRRRFVNGAVIGGVYYTGEHIFYLNLCSIERVFSKDTGVFKDKTKKSRNVGSRGVGFPDFWDEDYKYFTGCDIARYGTKVHKDEFGNPIETYLDAYHRIYHNIDTGLILDEDNLSGGLNHLIVKPRGVGFSWKLAAWNCYNLFLVPNTHNFIFADNSEYLGDKDGIMAKFVKLRSFIQDKAWFLRKNFYKASITDYSFATGFKVAVGGTEVIKGFNTSVNGVIIDGDSDKGRGKRGNGSFEEFGSFPKVGEVWQKYDSSTNQYGDIFGQARGGGTGGGTGEGYADLEGMFYDSKPYRLIRYHNPWEDNYRGHGVSMFTPAFINITFKDEFGNSQVEESKKVMDLEREEKKKSADPTVFTNHCAEKPYKPGEAFNAAGKNILPVLLAKEQLELLIQSDKDRTLCRYGIFEPSSYGGFKFKPLNNGLPYEAFPVKAGDKESCVVIYKEPYKINGKVPKNLYTISVDPYSDEEVTDSDSIGSWVVHENDNSVTQAKGDIEVCWYDGRPEGEGGQDLFCYYLFCAAEMYNAKIIIENNEKGNVVHYAITHRDSKGKKLTEYLHEQLALGYDDSLATKKGMKREFGIHMTEARKRQGLKDLQEHLMRTRGKRENPDGTITILRNINFVYNRGYLREIIGYNGKNADRISCRIVKMFAIKEYQEKNTKVITTEKVDSFFKEALFQ